MFCCVLGVSSLYYQGRATLTHLFRAHSALSFLFCLFVAFLLLDRITMICRRTERAAIQQRQKKKKEKLPLSKRIHGPYFLFTFVCCTFSLHRFFPVSPSLSHVFFSFLNTTEIFSHLLLYFYYFLFTDSLQKQFFNAKNGSY